MDMFDSSVIAISPNETLGLLSGYNADFVQSNESSARVYCSIHRPSQTKDQHLPSAHSLSTGERPNLYCMYGPCSSTPKKNKSLNFRSRHSKSPTMQSIVKNEEEVPTSYLPTMKGILTLMFCIVYAAFMFIAAALCQRIFSLLNISVVNSGGKVHSWESESKKHVEVRQRIVRSGN